MFCPHCGKNISDNIKFCPFCGTSIGTDQQTVNSQSNFYTSQNSANYPTPTYYAPNYNSSGISTSSGSKSINIFAIIGVILFVISIFLPFISSYYESISFAGLFSVCVSVGSNSNSMLFLFLSLAIFICMIVVFIMHLIKASQKAINVWSILSFVFFVIASMFIYMGISSSNSYGISLGTGFWLMLLAHIAILASGPIHKAVVKK